MGVREKRQKQSPPETEDLKGREKGDLTGILASCSGQSEVYLPSSIALVHLLQTLVVSHPSTDHEANFMDSG